MIIVRTDIATQSFNGSCGTLTRTGGVHRSSVVKISDLRGVADNTRAPRVSRSKILKDLNACPKWQVPKTLPEDANCSYCQVVCPALVGSATARDSAILALLLTTILKQCQCYPELTLECIRQRNFD